MTNYIEQVICREEMLSSWPNIAHSVKRIKHWRQRILAYVMFMSKFKRLKWDKVFKICH